MTTSSNAGAPRAFLRVTAFRGETESRVLGWIEDATLTAGGYDRADLAILRDPNGDPLAVLRSEGWCSVSDGERWDDIVIEAAGVAV